MKVLLDLNLSRNKIKSRGAIALSTALLHNNHISLWRLSVANCEITCDGTKQILNDIKYNRKLAKLILDGNEFDDETLAGPFLETMTSNHNLKYLSLSNCDMNDMRIQHVIDGLSVNHTLQSLNLSLNHLTSKAMMKFRETFEESDKPLNIKSLDLSSNDIDVSVYLSLFK